MKNNNLLSDFDLNNLDLFESMQYAHHIQYMSKEESLQVLINTVEGDYTQLSEELAEIANELQPTF